MQVIRQTPTEIVYTVELSQAEVNLIAQAVGKLVPIEIGVHYEFLHKLYKNFRAISKG